VSSDERRDVAARLRAAAKTESGNTDYLWNRLEIAVNGWRFGDVIDESYVFYNSVLARLADLIDPMCQIVDGPMTDMPDSRERIEAYAEKWSPEASDLVRRCFALMDGEHQ
jgi:hypothetical protein